MRTSCLKLLVAALFAITALPQAADASITRLSGPSFLFQDSKLFVKFDVAFDETARVYLVVWGTQAVGPTNGLFLNADGTPRGGAFAISDGPAQAGWARVLYSDQEGKFLVTYTKILGGGRHQRIARFVTSAAGPVGTEIILDDWTGHSGSDGGMAYSPTARKWFATWWNWSAPLPMSYVAVIDAATSTFNGARIAVTNPGDGQSDPKIACAPASKRCLVVGYAWGNFAGGLNSTWGRLIDDSTGAPVGTNSFYVDSFPVEGDPTVVFNAASNRFIVGYVRSFSSIWASTLNPEGTIAGPFLVKGSDGERQDGGGYGGVNLAYNSGSGTVLVAMNDWYGITAAQEIDGAATPISGGFDRLPTPEPNIERRTRAVAPAADAGTRRFLLLDNQKFLFTRATLYSTTGVSGPPPPPPTTSNPRMSLDVPRSGSTTAGNFTVAGWAADLASSTDGGVDAVHVWAYPNPGSGAAAVFVGSATMGIARPDVAAAFGSRFSGSGFVLGGALTPGLYDIVVYARSTVSGTFNNAQMVRITVISLPSVPRMWVDVPSQNQSVSRSFLTGGWAVDLGSTSGTGVDAIHVWAYPIAGGDPVFVGVATLGDSRPDIAAAFGAARFAAGGFRLDATLPPGEYNLVVFAHSVNTNSFNNAALVRIRVL